MASELCRCGWCSALVSSDASVNRFEQDPELLDKFAPRLMAIERARGLVQALTQIAEVLGSADLTDEDAARLSDYVDRLATSSASYTPAFMTRMAVLDILEIVAVHISRGDPREKAISEALARAAEDILPGVTIDRPAFETAVTDWTAGEEQPTAPKWKSAHELLVRSGLLPRSTPKADGTPPWENLRRERARWRRGRGKEVGDALKQTRPTP